MKIDVGQSERGWEITFDGIFGPEEEQSAYATEGEAKRAAENMVAGWRTHERAGIRVDCLPEIAL